MIDEETVPTGLEKDGRLSAYPIKGGLRQWAIFSDDIDFVF